LRIVSEKVLREFGAKRSDSLASLMAWKTIVRRASWKSSDDVKKTFRDSDRVDEKTVFNIARNRYRLIAFISFTRQIVYVKAILTHKEYDKGAWQ
jgi:mRNA interferase HigB